MNLTLNEKIELLKVEFPNLSLDDDADIERYFQLRKDGLHQQALSVYNGAIRRKYPDDGTRILLLRYYRAHDPRFQALLKQNLLQRADTLVIRYKKGIDYLTKDIATLNMRDAYSVIKAAESIIQVLGRDRYEAVSLADKYVSFSRRLNYKQELMQKTANLVRQYVTDSVDSIEALRKEQENRQFQQRRIQEETQHKKKSLFDLSKIHFSADEINKIEIPAQITRMEDKVLAYCLKYWNKIFDSAFEKTIFLYSKKYNKKNYNVFQAIKLGRTHNRRDGEILTSVLGTLTSGYFYSVQGDIYLQVMWRRLRGQDEAPVSSPADESVPKRTYNKKLSVKPEAEKQVKEETQNTKELKQPKKEDLRSDSLANNRSPILKETDSLSKNTASKDSKFKIPTHTQRKVILNAKSKKAYSSVHFSAPIKSESDVKAKLSVADIIKGISGRSYDLYKDFFLNGIAPFIKKELTNSRTTAPKFFDIQIRKAEELIYTFMADNYDNPFMDWEKSPQCKVVSELGYKIDSLVPIITNWYKSQK